MPWEQTGQFTKFCTTAEALLSAFTTTKRLSALQNQSGDNRDLLTTS